MGCYLHVWHLQFKFGEETAWFGVAPVLLFAHATNAPDKLIHSAWIWKNAGLELQWRQEFTLEGEVIGLTEGVILSAVFVCFSTQLLHWSILAIYTTETNASLNNNSLFLLALQPHWYITCFPLRPLACLWFDASPLGVEGPESPLPPHAFTGVLLLLCLITPAPE